MNPKSLQHRTLELYAEFHKDQPTTRSLWRMNLKPHLILVLLLGCIAAASWFLLGMPALSFLVIGAAAGSLLRDYGRMKQTVELWPMLEKIINWSAVDRLLEVTGDKNNQT